jgi:hypothetical protein
MKVVASRAIENVWFLSMRHTAGPGVADSVLLSNGMCVRGLAYMPRSSEFPSGLDTHISARLIQELTMPTSSQMLLR